MHILNSIEVISEKKKNNRPFAKPCHVSIIKNGGITKWVSEIERA